ncbi:hypothetical protein N9I35_00265 [Gammaproteobacteria bacterium]|nr:hypothetical protein [Gammaproteobacteria bacterium]
MNNFIKEKEAELLKEIREYTFNNKEFLNAHHFYILTRLLDKTGNFVGTYDNSFSDRVSLYCLQ